MSYVFLCVFHELQGQYHVQSRVRNRLRQCLIDLFSVLMLLNFYLSDTFQRSQDNWFWLVQGHRKRARKLARADVTRGRHILVLAARMFPNAAPVHLLQGRCVVMWRDFLSNAVRQAAVWRRSQSRQDFVATNYYQGHRPGFPKQTSCLGRGQGTMLCSPSLNLLFSYFFIHRHDKKSVWFRYLT